MGILISQYTQIQIVWHAKARSNREFVTELHVYPCAALSVSVPQTNAYFVLRQWEKHNLYHPIRSAVAFVSEMELQAEQVFEWRLKRKDIAKDHQLAYE